MTNHQIKYYAHELMKRSPAHSYERITNAIMSSVVDLLPHQVLSVLFFFLSPFSQGTIHAEEVGLGKTIIAALIILQNWLEGKRKILIIVPSSLRSQWQQELMEKFYLKSIILENGSFSRAKNNKKNPFDSGRIVICSYQFARKKAADISAVEWDLITIDEAHNLRNVYKKQNRMARELRIILEPFKKLLLTATPLQNSLYELHGLVSIIYENHFGDKKSFKAQYMGKKGAKNLNHLKERMAPICHRSLRRHVTDYVTYTIRVPMTYHYTPGNDEIKLYNLVSEYLQRKNIYAIKSKTRNLLIIRIRKILASSSYAIAATLNALIARLYAELDKNINPKEADRILWNSVGRDSDYTYEDNELDVRDENPLLEQDPRMILAEISELKRFKHLALSIQKDAKADILLAALNKGFQEIINQGGKTKVLIFTESKETQKYLNRFLNDSEYTGKIVLYNGSNNNEQSKQILKRWKKRHKGTVKVSSSKSDNMKEALKEYFRDEAEIMIATEAASEGLNLQFCSFILHYDLPWNPQRVEQRNGRCHRYKQKSDVIVLNLINDSNAADRRVYELLDEKFKLFDGVFGASDEILGVIGAGINFEKEFCEILQTYRNPEEINKAFDQLESRIDNKTSNQIDGVIRQKLLNNLDDEIKEKLEEAKTESENHLSNHKHWFRQITEIVLSDHADFDDKGFHLKSVPVGVTALEGRYTFDYDANSDHHYRIGHPLADYVTAHAQQVKTSQAIIEFIHPESMEYSDLDSLKGKSGWLQATKVTFESYDMTDEIIISCVTDYGDTVHADKAKRLLALMGSDKGVASNTVPDLLGILSEERITEICSQSEKKNVEHYYQEEKRLKALAVDFEQSSKVALRKKKDLIRVAKAQFAKASGSSQERDLFQKWNKLKFELTDLKADIAQKQAEIIKETSLFLQRAKQKTYPKIQREELFTINWELH